MENESSWICTRFESDGCKGKILGKDVLLKTMQMIMNLRNFDNNLRPGNFMRSLNAVIAKGFHSNHWVVQIYLGLLLEQFKDSILDTANLTEAKRNCGAELGDFIQQIKNVQRILDIMRPGLSSEKGWSFYRPLFRTFG